MYNTMKSFLILRLSISLYLLYTATYAQGQINRHTIKKNNKRIAAFSGHRDATTYRRYTAIGLSLNALNYYGDLAPLPSKFSTDISFTQPGFGISFFHRLGPRYGLMGNFLYGTLSGSDAESAKGEEGQFRRVRNLSFRNRIQELSLIAIIDLFENHATYMSRVSWTPYIFGGLAMLHHNPQAQAPKSYLDGTPDPYAGQWVDLQALGTEGQTSSLKSTDVNYGLQPYSLMQIAIPFGVGAKFKINDALDLWADIGFRYTFTDYLDDVSGNYVDLGVFQDKLAQALSYRSNEVSSPSYTYVGRDNVSYSTYNAGFGVEQQSANRGFKSHNDVYMVTSIKVTHILGKSFHRTRFR